MDAVNKSLMERPPVSDVISFSGFDLLAGVQKPSAGVSFVQLKDWKERNEASQGAAALAQSFMALNGPVKDAMVLAFTPPPITGMSNTGGFEAYVQDRGGAGPQPLIDATQKLVEAASKRPELAGGGTPVCNNVYPHKKHISPGKTQALRRASCLLL